MTTLECIVQALRKAASYNRHDLAAPRVIFWPDEDRLWARCIKPLRASYPALLRLGEYFPDYATGPAAWLRYQLEKQGGDVPVIYLPAIDRSAFRSADQCPNEVIHLFALQFQGQFWTRKSEKTGHHSLFYQVRTAASGLMPLLIKTLSQCLFLLNSTTCIRDTGFHALDLMVDYALPVSQTPGPIAPSCLRGRFTIPHERVSIIPPCSLPA